MRESVTERADRVARAYKRRRWAKSHKSDGFPWDDVVIGVLVGSLGVVASPATETWTRVFIGGGSALVGIGIWHLILTPLWRFVFVVPVEEHVTQAQEIHDRDTTVEQLQSQLAISEANVLVARERQRVLDRLAQEINHGQAYLQFAERGEMISLYLGHVNTWERTSTVFLSDQLGAEAFKRFESANVPTLPTRITPYRPDDHASLARRIRARLDVLEALRQTLQRI